MKDYLYQDNIKNVDFVLSRIGSEGKNILNNKPSDYRSNIKDTQEYRIEDEERMIGKFRLSGEVHQWMYDKFSLSRILESTGFTNVQVVRADESLIKNFNKYNLDVLENGEVRKPESLFMECQK